jgi:hypothetical protein
VTYDAGASTGCSVAGSTLSVINASGTCSVTATKAADANYNAANSAGATVTLTKANSNVTAWPTAGSIMLGQTLASSTLSGGSSTPAGTFAFTTPSTAPDAGTALQEVAFMPDDTTNYNPVTGTVSVTVIDPALLIGTTQGMGIGSLGAISLLFNNAFLRNIFRRRGKKERLSRPQQGRGAAEYQQTLQKQK